ncbi:alkaline phosphatase D family protein [Woodsholea maritima]|uniref:alkaline phosphatase D family protein n=1 Tax=Woodsholea maritima TaxID=240237 RepID=UPI000363B6E1|nr:alkaline phosphatase D family protein [Woodsholea maritima]
MALSRRLFLAATGAALWTPSLARAQSQNYHFTLGVASGSPRETSVVLWTRLAPDPENGGGMAPGRVQVRYRLCADGAMRQTVQDGLVQTSDAKAHSVHVTARNLEPGREYFYQFYYGEDESPIGRTRTASGAASAMKLAVATCQHYESGHFAAYKDMADWSPDCVVHVGDYIYEGRGNPVGVRNIEYRGETYTFASVRSHTGSEIQTLWDYRNRYAQYRSDPHLQTAHAAAPWIMAMDDHEIDNNWAGNIPQDPEKQTLEEFLIRKRAAFQAYYEHMPLEEAPSLAGLQQYNAYIFGPAQINLLDTRQYRSDQVCGDGFPSDQTCPDLMNPARTMTGDVQEAWLMEQLRSSGARYNVLAQQTWFAPYRYTSGREYNMDQWDGYPVQRQRLIDALSRDVANPIVLSGDWHSAAAMAIHKEPENPNSQKIGHEFAATSISSHCSWAGRLHEAENGNDHVAYLNGHKRGYLRCSADERAWTSTYRTVNDPYDPNSTCTSDAELKTSDF